MAENIYKASFVIDASFILTYLLPDEHNKSVDEQFIAHEHGKIRFISTKLMPFEVMNGLTSAIRQKRIFEKLARSLLRQMQNELIDLYDVDTDETFSLALKTNLTIYDAGYLWLARKNKIPLLTLDAQLTKAS